MEKESKMGEQPSQDWQTKSDYIAAQTLPAPLINRTSVALIISGIASIIFALCLTIWLVDMFILGDLTAVKYAGSRPIDGKPLATLAVLGMFASFFTASITAIVQKQKHGIRVTGIVLTVVGGLLVANPIGLIVAVFVLSCGFTGCSGF